MSGTIRVQWTDQAMVDTPRGTVATFQRHSYAARCAYADGTAVIVVLPPGAAQYPHTAWEPIVRKLADYTRRTVPSIAGGIDVVTMTSPAYSPPPPA